LDANKTKKRSGRRSSSEPPRFGPDASGLNRFSISQEWPFRVSRFILFVSSRPVPSQDADGRDRGVLPRRAAVAEKWPGCQ
jgi:hypothetical protein